MNPAEQPTPTPQETEPQPVPEVEQLEGLISQVQVAGIRGFLKEEDLAKFENIVGVLGELKGKREELQSNPETAQELIQDAQQQLEEILAHYPNFQAAQEVREQLEAQRKEQLIAQKAKEKGAPKREKIAEALKPEEYALTQEEQELLYRAFLGEQELVIDQDLQRFLEQASQRGLEKKNLLNNLLTGLTGPAFGGGAAGLTGFGLRAYARNGIRTALGGLGGWLAAAGAGAAIGGIAGGLRGYMRGKEALYTAEGWYQDLRGNIEGLDINNPDPQKREECQQTVTTLKELLESQKAISGSGLEQLKLIQLWQEGTRRLVLTDKTDPDISDETRSKIDRLISLQGRLGEASENIIGLTEELYARSQNGEKAKLLELLGRRKKELRKGVSRGAFIGAAVGAVAGMGGHAIGEALHRLKEVAEEKLPEIKHIILGKLLPGEIHDVKDHNIAEALPQTPPESMTPAQFDQLHDSLSEAEPGTDYDLKNEYSLEDDSTAHFFQAHRQAFEIPEGLAAPTDYGRALSHAFELANTQEQLDLHGMNASKIEAMLSYLSGRDLELGQWYHFDNAQIQAILDYAYKYGLQDDGSFDESVFARIPAQLLNIEQYADYLKEQDLVSLVEETPAAEAAEVAGERPTAEVAGAIAAAGAGAGLGYAFGPKEAVTPTPQAETPQPIKPAEIKPPPSPEQQREQAFKDHLKEVTTRQERILGGLEPRENETPENKNKRAWYEIFSSLSKDDSLKKETITLRKEWAQREGAGEDYQPDTDTYIYQTGEALHQTINKKLKDTETR